MSKIGVYDLAWKSVRVSNAVTVGDDEMGGFMGLEEISDVEGDWEEDNESGGRVFKIKARIILLLLLIYICICY